MKSREVILNAYWKKNLLLISVLMAIWFAASYGVVILFGDVLQNVAFMGTTLPFWFGQQGSILVFIGIVIVYAVRMEKMGAEIRRMTFNEDDNLVYIERLELKEGA